MKKIQIIILLLLTYVIALFAECDDIVSLKTLGGRASVILLVKKCNPFIIKYRMKFNQKDYIYNKYQFEIIKADPRCCGIRSLNEIIGKTIIVEQPDESYEMLKNKFKGKLKVLNKSISCYNPRIVLDKIDTMLIFVDNNWNSKDNYKNFKFIAMNSYELKSVYDLIEPSLFDSDSTILNSKLIGKVK